MSVDYNNIGTGADGAVVYGAGTHTLAADLNPTSLWVQAGATLVTANWRILCHGLLKIDGEINNNGRDAVLTVGGQDTSSSTPGSLPVFPVTGDTNRNTGSPT